MRGENPLSSRHARSESERGLLSPKATIILLVIGISLLLVFVLDQSAKAPIAGSKKVIAQLGGSSFSLEVADTLESRMQGLSERNSLADGAGMLFEFSPPDKACFWMKDTKVNLDMYWFDQDKKLVHAKQNVAPSTYPESFCPPSYASYVVEISPGQIQPKIGDILEIQKQ